MADFKLPGMFEYDRMVWTTTISSPKLIEGSRNLKMGPSDTVVATYSKSGTTWMKLVADMVRNDGVQKDVTVPLRVLAPFLDIRIPGKSDEEMLTLFTKLPDPRLFCTHLPFRVLEKQVLEDKAKVIVVMRNPKDTIVSFYHFYRMVTIFGFNGTWDDFFQLFTQQSLIGGDIFEYNQEWWKVRELDNVLIVKYEEMKEDLEGIVRKVAKFMGRDLSEEAIANVVHLTSFQQMKDDPTVNGSEGVEIGAFDFNKSKFLRKGVVGDWTNYFSEEQSKYVDKLCEEKFSSVGLQDISGIILKF